MVDYYSAPKKRRSEVDVGKFLLIHKGKKCAEAPRTCGVNLVCEGRKIKIY